MMKVNRKSNGIIINFKKQLNPHAKSYIPLKLNPYAKAFIMS